MDNVTNYTSRFVSNFGENKLLLTVDQGFPSASSKTWFNFLQAHRLLGYERAIHDR